MLHPVAFTELGEGNAVYLFLAYIHCPAFCIINLFVSFFCLLSEFRELL